MLARFLREAASQVGVPPHEYALLVERLLTLLTSCDERREQQWDLQSWWDFTGAERRSAAFQRFLADGLTRTLVAARGREMSARTGGLVLIQLLQDLTRAGGRADRVLDAPTSEVWIDPWVAHLEARGVELRLGEPVEALHVSRRGGITGATVGGPHGARRPLRRRAARRGDAPARLARAAGRRAAPEGPRPARHALDERGALLPRPRRAARQRPRDLHRLRVVADLDLAEAVLAGRGPVAARGRADARDPLDRRLGVAAAGPAARARSPSAAARDEIFDEVWGQLEDHLDGALDGRDGRSTASSTRRSCSRTRRAPPTSSRCWSTRRARGPTAPTR